MRGRCEAWLCLGERRGTGLRNGPFAPRAGSGLVLYRPGAQRVSNLPGGIFCYHRQLLEGINRAIGAPIRVEVEVGKSRDCLKLRVGVIDAKWERALHFARH